MYISFFNYAIKMSLESLLSQKKEIIDKVDSYYHTVSVATKHVTRFIITWKIRYTYHDEVRFDDAKFRKDLADIDVQINSLIFDIKNKESQYTSTKVYELQRQNRELDYKTTVLKQSLEEKQKVVQELQNTPAKLAALKKIEEENQARIASLEEQKQEMEKELEEFLKKMEEDLVRREPHVRAEMLAGVFHEEGAELLISHIIGVGIDESFLAYLAIQKNDKELLLYSLRQGVVLDTYTQNNKTLLQHALDSGDPTITSIALETATDFGCTIIQAIKRGDKTSLQKLLTHDSNLGYEVICGYSLLQHMVALKQYDMAIDFIKSDPNVVNIKNQNGDNVFKTALVSKAPLEFLEILAQHLDIRHEFFRLIENETAYHIVKHAVDVGFIDQQQIDESYQVYAISQSNTATIGELEFNEYSADLPNQVLDEIEFTGEIYTSYIEVI